MWPGGTQAMLSKVVCIPSFGSIAPWVCVAKVPFLALFVQTGTQKEVWPHTCI